MKNSSSSVPNVRLVRCPRCREVLPEPADVPFYKCGGCDTILQAKHYKKDNEIREMVSETSTSVQNNQVEYSAQGGETSSSNPPLVIDPNQGINQSNAENENPDHPGVSNSSREVSSSSHKHLDQQPKQQPPSSSSQHFLDRNVNTEQNVQVTNTLRGDSSLNEPSSPPSHELPSILVPETGQVEEDHRSVEQCGDSSTASSSNEPMEQLAQLLLENEQVRQDEIVVEEQLEAPDSSSEAASSEATTATADGGADERNQNVSLTNYRLEQPGVFTDFPSEALLSSEPSLHETNNSSQVAAEEGQVEESSTMAKEQLQASNLSSEPTLADEPTVGGDELSSQFGSPNEEVMTTEQHFVANPRERQPVSEVKCDCEVSSTNGPVSILNRHDSSSQVLTANEEREGDTVLEICSRDVDVLYSSSTVTSSNKSNFDENKELLQLVAENQDMDKGASQNELGVSNEDPGEIISPVKVNAKVPDESEIVLPEAEKTSGSILSFKPEVSTAPDEYGNRESQHSVEADAPADGNNCVPALPTLKPTTEDEVLSSDDRSQKTVETNPKGKIMEEKATETTEVVNAHFEAGTSCRDLPKSPTRSSFAYDGSVSSYDGNDDQVTYQLPSETMMGINKTEDPAAEDQRQYLSGRSTTSSGSAFQHKVDNLQAVSAGEYRHPEKQSAPVMLNEINMSEVLSDVPYRRNRMRPRTQEFPSRVPLYRRSPEMRYGSSGQLVHKEFYDHPIYYPPYRYRDVESRVTRRHLHTSDVDGSVISEAVWMGEEFHMYPYCESSSEIYPYPRHQMYHGGRRQTEYQPPVHSMARVPYSGETVRSGYRVLDSYSHLYPSDMRWSSHLPTPGVSYSRGRYGPKEPFDSYAASPQVFTDSDYYSRSHDTISEDQRHPNQRMRRNSQPAQHFQPIGGAAPFITCYQCSELLRLPSDFLVFREIRIHRVKCSACSSILKFTLEKGCHLVPYVPKPMAPGGADKLLLKSASTSQANHDYEALHRRSASASIYAAGGLRSSSSHVSERAKSKLESRPSQDKGKSIMVEMHKHGNAGGSTSPDIPRQAKVTWKVPDRSSSPLHRLMGYSSPSAVLYGCGSDDLEAQY